MDTDLRKQLSRSHLTDCLLVVAAVFLVGLLLGLPAVADQVTYPGGADVDDLPVHAYKAVAATPTPCPGAASTTYITNADNENNAHSGTPDNDMYPAYTGCMFNDDPLEPIEFNIVVPSLPSFSTARLLLFAWDIDEQDGERDEVYLNGHLVGTLTGWNDTWNTSAFNINKALVRAGNNLVEVRIDVNNVHQWCTSIYWGQLVLGGGGGAASIRNANIDRPHGCYVPGATVSLSYEVDTILSQQQVRVEISILAPNNDTVASTTRTYTTFSSQNDPKVEYLTLPSGAKTGTYTVQVIVYDTCSNTQQGFWTDTFRVDPACGPVIRKVYLPLIMKCQWVTLVSMDFEGPFPGPWTVFDNDDTSYGEYYWAKRTCRPYAGSYSGWGVGGGANGASLACGSNYPDNADSWMEYGPFSLVGATAGELRFKLWLNSESNNDVVCRWASINDTDFYGTCTSGNTSGWVDKVLDLKDVYTLGNLMGQPNVWVALVFYSNGSVNYAEGGYVDNIVLRKCTAASCPASVAPNFDHDQTVDIPATMTRGR